MTREHIVIGAVVALDSPEGGLDVYGPLGIPAGRVANGALGMVRARLTETFAGVAFENRNGETVAVPVDWLRETAGAPRARPWMQ
jgi:hypothetical protein